MSPLQHTQLVLASSFLFSNTSFGSPGFHNQKALRKIRLCASTVDKYHSLNEDIPLNNVSIESINRS